MPTRDQDVEIPITGGLDQAKPNEKAAPPSLIEATNVRVEKEGEVSKRPGMAVIDSTGPSITNRITGVGIHENAVVALAGEGLYRYDPEPGAVTPWNRPSRSGPRSVDMRTISLGSAGQPNQPDIAVATSPSGTSVACIVWREVELGVVSVFYDLDNEVVLSGPTRIGDNYQANPRVVAANSNAFFLVASDGTATGDSLFAAYYSLSPGTYTWTTNGTTFSATGNGNVYLAGHPSASQAFCLAGNANTLYRLNAAGSASASISGVLTGIGDVGALIVDDDNDRVIEFTYDFTAGGNVRTFDISTLAIDFTLGGFITASDVRDYVSAPYWCDVVLKSRTSGVNNVAFIMGTSTMSDNANSTFAGGVLWTEFSVDTIGDSVTPGDINQFPGVNLGAGITYNSDESQLFFGIQNLLTETATTSAFSPGANSTMLPSDQGLPVLCLATPAVRTAWPRDTTYTGVTDRGHVDTDDALTKTGNDYTGGGSGSGTEDMGVVARMSSQLARDSYFGAASAPSITPKVGDWYWTVYVEDTIRGLQEDQPPGVPASRVQLTKFRNAGNENAMADIHGSLHIDTGYVAQFDGVSASEVGWHWEPRIANFGNEEGTGGATDGEPTITDCRVCLVWVDGNGRVHRSPPSGLGQFYANPDLTEGWLDVVVPPSAISGDSAAQWAVEIYDGTAGSETLRGIYFDKVPSPNEGTWRVTYGPTTFTDTAQAIALYTNANAELANDGTLSVFASASSKDFFFYIPHTQDKVYYCKKINDNKPLEFNEELQIRVPADGGKLTGLAAMDNTLLVFKRNSVYAVNIPNVNSAFSQGIDFRVPGPLPAGTGCLYPASVHVSVLGCFFQSDKGIYLITRGRDVQFVGAGIQDALVNREVVSVAEVTGQREILFLLDTPGGTRTTREALVFNYEHEVWTKWEDYPGTSAFSDENRLIAADGQNVREFSSSSTGYVGISTTTHLDYAFSTGWVSTVGILGFQRVKRIEVDGEYTNGRVRVEVFYDGESTAHDTFDYLDGDVTFPLRVKPTRAKCKSFRVRVSDTSGTTNTAGFTIRGVSFTAGLKRGLYRRIGERQNR